MKNQIDIIFTHIKYHKLSYLIPVLVIYLLILPYCLYNSFLVSDHKEIIYYTYLQRYLFIVLLFLIVPFIKNYIESDLKELLYTFYKQYKIIFMFYLYILTLIILLPLIMISLYFYKDCLLYLIWMLIQILIIYILFFFISFISHSILVGFGSIFIYTGYMNFINQTASYFNLYRFFGFYDVSYGYFIGWIVFIIIMIVLSIIFERVKGFL